eukprot:5840099-Pleurochrysis_carterae.AAC.2
MAAATVTSATFSTPHTSDAVACCKQRPDFLVCATYQLMKEEVPPRRVGELLLISRATTDTLEVVQSVGEGTGVLDCAWYESDRNAQPLLGAACSDGCLHLYSLEADHLVSSGSQTCPDAGVCMALAWSKPSASRPRAALSSTAGRLYLVDLSENGPRLLQDWDAHTLEGWAVAFDPSDDNTVYSGGDDCLFQRWDLRCSLQDGDAPQLTGSNRRSHRAGVCCISPHPTRPFQVATGSYDETFRLWDCRQLKAPVHEVSCGGGVWRIKWHSLMPEYALTACMHAGFTVLHLDQTGSPSVHATYIAHGSGTALAYGVDWVHSEEELIAASCSFYDQALHIRSRKPACYRPAKLRRNRQRNTRFILVIAVPKPGERADGYSLHDRLFIPVLIL